MHDNHDASRILDMAGSLAERLTAIDGVQAVVLGGSWARGAGDANSDIDLGIYYDPAHPLDIEGLRTLAVELGNDASSVNPTGAWGPWINGGAWLTVNDQRVDWLYRDLTLVRQVMAECTAGQPKVYYQPGHPHGFHTHSYLAEITLCRPLSDPHGTIAALKTAATPYPPALKRALIENSLWEAGFALDTSRKSALRGDVFHVAGGLFRSAACMAQALFALNERYWLNEKGSVQAISGFPLRPSEWEARVNTILSQPGSTPAALTASLAVFDSLLTDIDALSEQHP